MMTRVAVVLVVVLSSCGGSGDDSGEGPDLVALGVDGTGSQISAVAFGEVAAGSSAMQTIVVANEGAGDTGGLTLTVSAATPFSIAGTDCELSLAAAATCQVMVEFTPTSDAAFAETLTITGSAAASGDAVSLALTGSGD